MAEAGPSSSNDASSSGIQSPEQRLERASDYKNAGNECYKNKDYKGAIGKYHRALMCIKDLDMGATRRNMSAALGLARPGPGQDQAASSLNQATIPQHMLDQAAEFELSCLNNLAVCLLQLPAPDYSKVEYYCNQVLDRSDRNVKALYRRGVARYHLHDYEGAHKSLSKANRISPESNIKKYLQLCDKAMLKQAEDERTRYKGMFDKLAAKGDH
ncbi:tetratricopeptide repeat protein 9C-like [Lytechinus variegatus]|uniref:tetratricopeptide repeat protein 9C-like n=1 Tax=Lytechinus variegatus TaxID=7654 RepID=UPI001BB15661|nr:tetratricopeptide repeat protein 9C-like [Lytechinus variegatus]XP_041467874.1 tetratricopeptide repeat protein 9C-like [Lytechinus variegatus]XP_041467875.1 tetratricopeptide repeat protein 9C-like [Lytechinus variegatus]XP_041467876.1 tetratricopeptide repeat protein 9C-like [Lytechinus variegatus]